MNVQRLAQIAATVSLLALQGCGPSASNDTTTAGGAGTGLSGSGSSGSSSSSGGSNSSGAGSSGGSGSSSSGSSSSGSSSSGSSSGSITGNTIVAAASPTGQVSATVGGASQTVAVTFTSSDGNPATALAVTSLGALPGGWSAAGSSFSCASVTTGTTCQLSLTYAPTAAASGTLQIGYSYQDNTGAAKTGSVSVQYAAAEPHLFVTDHGGAVYSCAIGTNGAPGGCGLTGASYAFSDPFAIAFNGNNAYVAEFQSIDLCQVDTSGNLSNCVDSGSGTLTVPATLTPFGGKLFMGDSNSFDGPATCDINPDGTLTNCALTNAVGNITQATSVAFAGGYAYVGTDGNQGRPGILVCSVSGTTLSGCVDSGSGVGSSGYVFTSGALVYAINGSNMDACTVGNAGALTCSAFAVSVGGTTLASQFGDVGGAAINNGIAYLTYTTININTMTTASGVASCSVQNDGTFASCTDAGVTLSGGAGVALH